MNNQTKREKNIRTNIIALPIMSMILLSIIVSTVFVVFLEDIKEKKINELKTNLTTIAKKTTKERILNIEDEIQNEIQNLNKNTKEMLKTRIHEASSIVYKIIKENPDKSIEEIKKLVGQVLGAIRYNNNRGYYYVYDYVTKKIIVHPIKKFINVDFTNIRDKRGTLMIQGDDKIAEGSGEGFRHLYFAKPNFPNQEFEKINYIIYIKKLNWIIGTGEYIEDAKKELQKTILKKIENKRYANGRYFWVHDTNYTLLAHPFRKKDIGKHDSELKDSQGTKIIQLFVNSAIKNKDGTLVEYFWRNSSEKEDKKKLSFIKHIKEWDWAIGTGLYLDNIDSLIQESKETVEKEIHGMFIYLFSIITVSLLIVIAFSFFLSKKTGKLFNIYKNDLEGKIEQAILENTKKDKMLQQQSKLASMGEMLGNIAHQWRQPLNALNINIQNLDDDFDEGLIDEKFIEKFIDKNREIIEFMSHTIDDFKNFFRIDKKKTIFSAKNAVQKVLSIQSATLKGNNITVKLRGKDFSINGYESEFKQVILNITNNAKDALLDKRNENRKIEITLKSDTITIKDNANGIPQNIINKIFEPYFTTKHQSQGTGLGLYMTNRIITQSMQGSIKVENTSFVYQDKEYN